MTKVRLDLEGITVETFTPQPLIEEALTTPVCTRYITCTNCPDGNTCIC
jgi:hypothetical protein